MILFVSIGMGYEIFISPKDTKDSTSLESVLKALSTAGLSPTASPDEFGHWVSFNGFESALNLEVKNGNVLNGGMKLNGRDNPMLLEKIVTAFHGLNWSVGDDEGELE